MMEIKTAVDKVCTFVKGIYPPRTNGKTVLAIALNTIVRYVNEQEEKNNKYRWHDLRKDPSDLPIEDMDIVLTDGEKYFCGHTYMSTHGVSVEMLLRHDEGYCDTSNEGYVSKGNFIAWKYIESFMEE